MYFILLYLIFSCNKDSDLFAESITSNDTDGETKNFVVNDHYLLSSNESIELDVLTNDITSTSSTITILKTSLPAYGSVELNDGKTKIIYTPTNIDSTENTSDIFTYTVEIINADKSVRTETGTIEITLASTENSNQSPRLLFSSGFDDIVLSTPCNGYTYIEGTDLQTGFTWPPTILGSGNGLEPSGIHSINDDGGAAVDNRIETTTDRKGDQSAALFQRVNYDVQVTQTPYQINNIKENPNELYISYWMKTDGTSIVGKDKWRAIWEYKTKNYASYKDGFRMIAFMATDYDGKPYWLFQGDTSPQDPIWQTENRTIPVLLNEWFKVEYYIKWSDGPNGYASMKVNGQIIGEHHGATTSNSDDLDFIILTQVYGNSYPMHQWVDDIEIWDGLPVQ